MTADRATILRTLTHPLTIGQVWDRAGGLNLRVVIACMEGAHADGLVVPVYAGSTLWTRTERGTAALGEFEKVEMLACR